MITLDTNLTIQSSSFHYLLNKLRRKYGYTNRSIEKYTESYASNGIPQTDQAEKTNEVNGVNDVNAKENLNFEQIIKELKLNVAENRFALLMMIPRSELFQMLQLLGKDKLLNGLRFFSKEKLMGLIGGLPKQELLKMLFQAFTDPAQLIENLPTKELYSFLRSDKIEKGHFMKMFELMPQNTLATIGGYLTKKNCDKMSKKDLLQEIKGFEKFHIVDSFKKLDEKSLRNFVTTMTESFPKLYNEFSHLSMFKVAERFARTDLIDSMIVLDDSKIINMLAELPDKLLALTVSQIDPEVFAALLLNDYQDLLANLVLG